MPLPLPSSSCPSCLTASSLWGSGRGVEEVGCRRGMKEVGGVEEVG